MSRTFRRKSGQRTNRATYFAQEDWWTHERVCKDDGSWVKVKLEGKEYWKGYWRYHGDRIKHWTYPKGLRKESHRAARLKNKREIVSFIQNEDYEVMTHKPRDLSYDM